MLSIVIPTCNRNDLLSKCLDLLAPSIQTIDEPYQIIVTDDSNNDITKKMIADAYPAVQWVEGPGRGPAANRNNGAISAKGDWLVFIDDDVLPDQHILSQYKKGILENDSILAFEGAILPDDWDLLRKDMAECPVNTEGNCFWSANVCIQKQLFKKVGGFDETFILAAQEDQDLFNKLKKITRVVFLQKCFVVHPVRFVSLRRKIKLVPSSIKNWYFFARKEKSFLKCLSKGMKSQVKALLNNFKSGKIKSAIYHIYIIVVFFPLMIKFKIIDNE